MDDTKKYIQISDIEEKYFCTSMQTFSNDFPLNSMQNLPVIASESEEKFVFSPSNVVVGVKISNTLDILEKLSDCRSDPFTLLDLDLVANFYKVACTNIQNFEKGENCASTISVDHTFGFDMNFIGFDMILSDLILLGSRFQVHELSVLLVAVLINFGVKKQVPQVSFKIVARDFISIHSFGSDINIFGYYNMWFRF